MAKQNKNTSDAPVDNKVNDVVATDEKKADENQTKAIHTEPKADEINNDNDQQGATPESLGTETESEATGTQGAGLDDKELGKFTLLNGALYFEVSLANIPRFHLEQLIEDCELNINPDGLTDDEVREAIDEAIQNQKAEQETTQAEYEARLSESDKEKINKVAASVFAKRNYEALYFTSDGVPFETENTAKQHAAKLENKAVVKRTKSDL